MELERNGSSWEKLQLGEPGYAFTLGEAKIWTAYAMSKPGPSVKYN